MTCSDFSHPRKHIEVEHRLPEGVPFNPETPEAGVDTALVNQRLFTRKDNAKIWIWADLWRALFPKDKLHEILDGSTTPLFCYPSLLFLICSSRIREARPA